MGFTGDNRTRRRAREEDKDGSSSSNSNRKSVLGGWIAASPLQHAESSPRNNNHNTNTKIITDNDTAQDTVNTKSPPSSTRFGFLSSIISSPAPAQRTNVVDDDDALLDLDIDAALFPTHGSTDAFSPAAFKNLQLNAIGLLCKFQNAHRRRTAELRCLRAEQDDAADLREEAEMRAHHLKLMLEDMARQIDEQEQLMHTLLEELAAEKERKAQSEEELSVFMSEDLGFDECGVGRQHWRKSNSSTILSMDTDLDSNDGASLFSQSRSPTMAPSMFEGSPPGGASTSSSSSSCVPSRAPTLLPPGMSAQPPPQQPRSSPSTPVRQITALQKLFKGMSGDAKQDNPVSKCRNCDGQTSAVAWDTVGLLRDENRGLKRRVEELQAGVEAALDMVNGVGL